MKQPLPYAATLCLVALGFLALIAPVSSLEFDANSFLSERTSALPPKLFEIYSEPSSENRLAKFVALFGPPEAPERIVISNLPPFVSESKVKGPRGPCRIEIVPQGVPPNAIAFYLEGYCPGLDFGSQQPLGAASSQFRPDEEKPCSARQEVVTMESRKTFQMPPSFQPLAGQQGSDENLLTSNMLNLVSEPGCPVNSSMLLLYGNQLLRLLRVVVSYRLDEESYASCLSDLVAGPAVGDPVPQVTPFKAIATQGSYFGHEGWTERTHPLHFLMHYSYDAREPNHLLRFLQRMGPTPFPPRYLVALCQATASLLQGRRSTFAPLVELRRLCAAVPVQLDEPKDKGQEKMAADKKKDAAKEEEEKKKKKKKAVPAPAPSRIYSSPPTSRWMMALAADYTRLRTQAFPLLSKTRDLPMLLDKGSPFVSKLDVQLHDTISKLRRWPKLPDPATLFPKIKQPKQNGGKARIDISPAEEAAAALQVTWAQAAQLLDELLSANLQPNGDLCYFSYHLLAPFFNQPTRFAMPVALQLSGSNMVPALRDDGIPAGFVGALPAVPAAPARTKLHLLPKKSVATPAGCRGGAFGGCLLKTEDQA